MSINCINLFLEEGIKGTGRKESVINAFPQFMKFPFFGTGRLYYENYLKEEAEVCSIIGYSLLYGVIGFFLVFFMYFIFYLFV